MKGRKQVVLLIMPVLLCGCSKPDSSPTNQVASSQPGNSATGSQYPKVTYKDDSGEMVTVNALPGKVYLYVKPGPDRAPIQELVERYHGKILSFMYNSYEIEITPGKEGAFIEEARTKGWSAYPNLIGTTH